MRDKQTQRGRGFGFVKMQFDNRDKAQEHQDEILSINRTPSGHIINDKKVDVKSTDNYVKPNPGTMPQGMGMGMSQFNPMAPMQQPGQVHDPVLNVTKPNPYVIAEQVDESQGYQQKKEVVFKYPRSKIFVGGLDFKLTNEDLKQHFLQFGPIESAVILKDINTGQSRGFGFVTFVDESVADNLVNNIRTTTIFGRKVDINSSTPK